MGSGPRIQLLTRAVACYTVMTMVCANLERTTDCGDTKTETLPFRGRCDVAVASKRRHC